MIHQLKTIKTMILHVPLLLLSMHVVIFPYSAISHILLFCSGFLSNGIYNVNVATLERRFDLHSSEIAWLIAAQNLAAGLAAAFCGYYGDYFRFVTLSILRNQLLPHSVPPFKHDKAIM